MTAVALARTNKADMQVNVPAVPTNTNAPLGVTHLAAFAHVKEIVASGRPLKRPNRNRPVHVLTPSLDDLLAVAADNPPPREFYEGDSECPW